MYGRQHTYAYTQNAQTQYSSWFSLAVFAIHLFLFIFYCRAFVRLFPSFFLLRWLYCTNYVRILLIRSHSPALTVVWTTFFAFLLIFVMHFSLLPHQSSQVQCMLVYYYTITIAEQYVVSPYFHTSLSLLLPPRLYFVHFLISIKFIHWIVKSLNSNKRCCAFACDYHERIRYRNKNGKALKIVVGMTSKMLKHTISHLHWAHTCAFMHIYTFLFTLTHPSQFA